MSEEINETEKLATPGIRLRTERERRGLSLAQVAGEMHMDVLLAGALEKDDYSSLGAPIFVKGHLRNYAKLLGLPVDEIVLDYEQMATPQTPELMTNRPTVGAMNPVNPGSSSWLVGIGVFLLILLVLFLGLWLYGQRSGVEHSLPGFSLPGITENDNKTTENAARPDSALSKEAFNSTPAPIDPLLTDTSKGAVTQDNTPQQSSLAPTGLTDTSTNVPTRHDATDVNAAADNITPTSREPVIEPLILELRFSEDSWVEVYGADDRPLLYELGQAGQIRQLQAKPPVRVFLGNAPAVQVSVNGAAFDISDYQQADSTARFTLKGD